MNLAVEKVMNLFGEIFANDNEMTVFTSGDLIYQIGTLWSLICLEKVKEGHKILLKQMLMTYLENLAGKLLNIEIQNQTELSAKVNHFIGKVAFTTALSAGVYRFTALHFGPHLPSYWGQQNPGSSIFGPLFASGSSQTVVGIQRAFASSSSRTSTHSARERALPCRVHALPITYFGSFCFGTDNETVYYPRLFDKLLINNSITFKSVLRNTCSNGNSDLSFAFLSSKIRNKGFYVIQLVFS